MQRTFYTLLIALLAFALPLAGCARASSPQAISPTCNAAKIVALQKQGDADIRNHHWYQAHLVGHALMAIGDSCNQVGGAATAMTHGLYMRAVAAYETQDPQARGFVNAGLTLLASVKKHEMESPDLVGLYDEMEPRFLTLEVQVH